MILEYNLQFFAKDGPGGEKTELPTPKKLQDARKEGQVAKSKEIANAAMLLALFASMTWVVSFYGGRFRALFGTVYTQIPDIIVMYEGDIPVRSVADIIKEAMLNILIILAPALAIGFVVPFICDLVQVKWAPTTKPLKPKFNKLNPINGVKRLFSLGSLVELLKSFLKILVIGSFTFFYVKSKQDRLFVLLDLPIMETLSELLKIIVGLGIRISGAYILIAAADYIYQKWKFREDQRMTKQEVKDEYKNTEGDPQIKGQQKKRMMEASRRRMMQDLPQADVVITNPTHYAVAIKYDPERYDAPYVVAKGADYLAARIKEVARDNDIEVVENKPLARMLYANVEIGQIVPPELYQAVAEVLAFVYRIKGKA